MPSSAIALLLVSALAHAVWNLLGKGRTPSLGFFAAAEGSMALVGLVCWPWTLPMLAELPARFWCLLAISCACQAGYYAGVAAAYRANDLSAAYPLVRALPVALLTVFAGLLGWRTPTLAAGIGIAVVVLGSLLVPLSSWGSWRRILGAFAQPSILVAASCGAAYTAIDATLSGMVSAQAGAWGILALASVMVLGNALGCAALALALPAERSRLPALRGDLPRAALAGVGIWLSYGAMLAALPLVGNPGFAAAFRQLSIPLGVLFGVLFLRERPGRPRQVGIAAIVAGLVVVALGR